VGGLSGWGGRGRGIGRGGQPVGRACEIVRYMVCALTGWDIGKQLETMVSWWLTSLPAFVPNNPSYPS
jgi:hypothetical protein